MGTDEQKRELALDLHEIGALKFGEFTFKSGIVSPMYIDLRLFISHPKAFKKVIKLYAEQLKDLKYDRLGGVAYAALPIAGAISLEIDKPWIYMRKEGLQKDHGLKKAIEGEYNAGETVVMIEDLVTQATSLLEAIGAMKKHGLVIKDAVVLLDYDKGGADNLAAQDYSLHAFMTVREAIEIMHAEGKIDDAKYAQCLDFLKS